MDHQLAELLKPEILHTVNGLELVARIVVEGFMNGSNRSKSIGVGYEFSQYRGYEPGDDLRLLDWKMFARAERYYIKQSEIETNITVKFILDASHSMDYAEKGMSKLQYSKILIAALAYLARKQSDTYGLYAINSEHIRSMEPRFDQQHFLRFLYQLIQIKSEGTWGVSKDLEALQYRQGKELIVVISDLYDVNNDIGHFISTLKTGKNEVVVFHLMGEEEMSLSHEGIFTFQDLETGERKKIDTVQQRNEYKMKVADWIQQTRLWMLERQIDYQLVQLNEPAEHVLTTYLDYRKRLFR